MEIGNNNYLISYFLFYSAAVIGFEQTEYSGDESDGAIQVFVAVLQGELSGPVVVRISTMDGTALSGSDYESVSQNLLFDPDITRISVSVPILDDDIEENQETIRSSLVLESSDSGRAPNIEPSMALLFIVDNDSTLIIIVRV